MNSMDFCDLHLHSSASDGTLSPHDLVTLALQKGLRAIALTDHNTTAGLRTFSEAAEQRIEFACGIEYAVEWEGQELHLIGLFLPLEMFEVAEAKLQQIRIQKAESLRLCVQRLQGAGYRISYDKLLAQSSNKNLNRVHLANLLIENGYVRSVKEALYQLLDEKGPYYYAPKRLKLPETIAQIHAMGAVAVLAHPLLQLSEQRFCRFLPIAKAMGLDAIETDYSSYTPEQTTFARQIATEFGLLRSGGSDFHGNNKPGLEMGTGRGNLKIPYEYFAALQMRAVEYRDIIQKDALLLEKSVSKL